MNKILLILLMMVVTFIPRLIPFLFTRKEAVSTEGHPTSKRTFFIIKVLKSVPYAALGALILPGGIMAIPGHPWISLLGLGGAGILAFWKGHTGLAVGAAVLVTYVGLLFG